MSLPPGSRLPSLVQVGRWIVHPLRLLDECQRRYGDVFTWRAPRGKLFVIVADPDLIKQVLTEDAETLLAGASNAPMLEPILGKQSLLMLDGAEHLRQRRLLLPSFHGAQIQAFATAMREITAASLASWPMHRPFALHTFMQDITLEVILRTVFGVSAGPVHDRLRTALIQLLDLSDNQWLLLPGMLGVDPFRIPWLRMTKLKRAVDDAIFQIIAERKRQVTGGADVLSMMVAARDEQGREMTDIELRDELVTLLIAGHETTATALAWTFDQLLSHPSTLERLRAEIVADRTDYVDAVIRETLRVRPIVPLVGRVTVKPYELGRWRLPAGAHIAPSIYLAGRRADAYPDPAQFKPERWLGVKPDPYTWLPFGGGIRRCLGMAFAQQEMRIVLQTVVPRATMRLVDGPAAVVRRGITLTPAKGTRVILTERASQTPSQRATSA